MALHHGIVEDALFQLFEQFLPADVAEILHIFQIDLAELVQGCRKGFLRCIHMCHLVGVERYGHGEYVRLLYLPVDGTLQREHFPSSCIQQQELGVVLSVQLPEHAVETVILPVQFLP